MNIFWKGAAVLGLTIASIGVTAVPAQAQYYGDRDGRRDSWRGGGDSRWGRDHRWNNRREWRRSHRDYRGYRSGYRQRCWTESRYDHYRDRRVRVRICR